MFLKVSRKSLLVNCIDSIQLGSFFRQMLRKCQRSSQPGSSQLRSLAEGFFPSGSSLALYGKMMGYLCAAGAT